MSAIFGIFNRSGEPASQHVMQHMSNALAHRGNDNQGIAYLDEVGLGHRMLWTTPESLNECLPLVGCNRQIIITADARIDNREDLIKILDLRGKVAEDVSDSELILHAYMKWGIDCPGHLLGDFSFAIWDARDHTLFCARDYFGIRPFYYHFSDSKFVFANEIKGVLTCPGVPRQLNELMISDYLSGIFLEKEQTLYKGIKRLPPAHYLLVRKGAMHLGQYWALDQSREIHLKSDDEYAEAFKEIFDEAVRARLRSAFPIGAKLSGGLDSSSIACVARDLIQQQGGGPLSTFSLIFDQVAECDERPYINKVLEQGGFDPHFIEGDKISPFYRMDDLFWHTDVAYWALGPSQVLGVCEEATRSGVRVLLDGHDGDGVVSHGYHYLHELAIKHKWVELTKEVWSLPNVSRSNLEIPRILKEYFHHYRIKPLINEHRMLKGTQHAWRAIRRRASSLRGARAPLIKAEPPRSIHSLLLASRTNMEERQRTFKMEGVNRARSARDYHYRTLSNGLQTFAHELHDSIQGAFPLECRYPFFDRRLVEFCLALPGNQKLRRGLGRAVMRHAMTGVLPEEIRTRVGKTDFFANHIVGFLSLERRKLEDAIEGASDLARKYIDFDVLREKFELFASEPKPNRAELGKVWWGVTMALWLDSAWSTVTQSPRKEVVPM
jgi:asparagine synthase (glutamine-hydrolysing)